MKFHCLNNSCDLIAEVISYKKNQMVHCPHCNDEMLEEAHYESIRQRFERVENVSDDDIRKVLDEQEEVLRLSAKGMLKEVQKYIQAFYKLLIDPNAQRIHKAIVVAALLYMISPLDLIPDIFVGVGYLDDIAVTAGTGARNDRNAGRENGSEGQQGQTLFHENLPLLSGLRRL